MKRALRDESGEMERRWREVREVCKLEGWADEGSLRISFGKVVWAWTAVALTTGLMRLD